MFGLGAIEAILKIVAPIITRFFPDPEKQAEINLELQKALMDQQGKVYDAMQAVMTTDANQDDKYTKRARPTVVYWSMAFATLIGVAGFFGHAQPMIDALRQIPTDLWTLMTVGIGAFGFSRSVEKGIDVAVGKKK